MEKEILKKMKNIFLDSVKIFDGIVELIEKEENGQEVSKEEFESLSDRFMLNMIKINNLVEE